MGVLRNWVVLQNSNNYNCFFFIADWHSLTTKYSETANLKSNIIEITKDFLASGLNPEKSSIYLQSAIPEIAEIFLLLGMLTPNNWAERDPTLKDLVKGAKNSGINELTYGMLGYPILQTADILTFKGEVVPVGKDQEAHLEMSREIARRFNFIFNTNFFPEPKPLFTDTASLKGVDNNKMSKSFNNDIKISATEEETINQTKKMITDPLRMKRSDAGSTKRCQVAFPYYEIFANTEIINKVKQECETAQRGCVDCKIELGKIINAYFKEIREKRNDFTDKEVLEILEEGNMKAQIQAKECLFKVKEIMKLN